MWFIVVSTANVFSKTIIDHLYSSISIALISIHDNSSITRVHWKKSKKIGYITEIVKLKKHGYRVTATYFSR